MKHEFIIAVRNDLDQILVLQDLATGAPDQALAVARPADLGLASYVERFKVAKGTAKSINFYDLALLTDLAQLYRESGDWTKAAVRWFGASDRQGEPRVLGPRADGFAFRDRFSRARTRYAG